MDISLMKIELIQRLTFTSKSSVLERVKQILDEEEEENKVIGTTPSGNQITQKDLMQRARKANDSIENGKIHSIQDVRKHFNSKD